MGTVEKKRGRGRPRSFDVDVALDRAVEIFWKNGYEGADLDTLTEAMEINRPSLYAAYGDKRALFFKAVERYYQTFAMLQLPDGKDGKRFGPLFFSEAIVHLFYDHERPRGCLIACVLADEANAHEDAKAILKEIIEREERRIERWANGFLSGDSAAANARCFANLLVATLHSAAIKASAGISRRKISSDLAATMSILMGILDT
ncbi:TetR/AcrR family transcriptional regulator [Paraburkholderia sp. CNPSo 3076]|uniref:TetR/AcrR family transcriptional regulator n=1 Tax=Paraburkholderia sp. CNPSo 3076 TaxID=2940936 RepID=UPI002256CB4F|nr:TetR/AcrR family transcriptional regulator [Paraburkholderia sp. CNPSo 3076]MCX5540073.1 TetR/AcrR family transcriptional regulator [Paraburkholderia sp. CNPSo 3076]